MTDKLLFHLISDALHCNQAEVIVLVQQVCFHLLAVQE